MRVGGARDPRTGGPRPPSPGQGACHENTRANTMSHAGPGCLALPSHPKKFDTQCEDG